MSTQLFNAWLILLQSLSKRVDVLSTFLGALILGCALLLVFQVVNFSEVQLKDRLKAIYPDQYTHSMQEPLVEGLSFERHLLSRNQSLLIELANHQNSTSILLPDLRIRSATQLSTAAGVYPSQIQVYVTRPIFNRLNELLDKKQPLIGLQNLEGEQVLLEVSLLPLETNERWLILHPETASSLQDFGPARMQTWIPYSDKKINSQQLKQKLQEENLTLETWENLLPLSNRLIFSLLTVLAPWMAGFIFVLGLVFVALFSQAYINQIHQWLNIAAFYVGQPKQLWLLISVTSLFLTAFLIGLVLIIQRALSYYLAQFLPEDAQDTWMNLLPSIGWVFLALPAAILVFILVKITWLPTHQAYWEGDNN